MPKFAFTLVFDIDFSQYEIEEKALLKYLIEYLIEILDGDSRAITDHFLEPNRLTIDIVLIADCPDDAENYLNAKLHGYTQPPNNMTIIRINNYD